MKFLVKNSILLHAISISLIFIHGTAIASSKIEIQLLKGTASLITKSEQVPLSSGDLIGNEDMVQTGPDSRVEIMLPDGSYIRFDEHTIFKLKAISVDSKDGTRHINVNLIVGKIWGKIRAGVSLTVSTKTAIAKSMRSVFRANAGKDDTTQIKAYLGEVKVMNKPVPAAVSNEGWSHIIQALQQIVVHPDGTATKPFRFSIKADENEWVRWNRKRDIAQKK